MQRMKVQTSAFKLAQSTTKANLCRSSKLSVMLFWVPWVQLILWIIWALVCIVATFLGLVSPQWSGAWVASVLDPQRLFWHLWTS